MRCTALQVAGDHRGGSFIALGDEVMEILVLRRAQWAQPEIVNQKQWDLGQLLHAAIKGIGGARGVQAAEQLWSAW